LLIIFLLHEKFQERTFKDVGNVGQIKIIVFSLRDTEKKIQISFFLNIYWVVFSEHYLTRKGCYVDWNHLKFMIFLFSTRWRMWKFAKWTYAYIFKSPWKLLGIQFLQFWKFWNLVIFTNNVVFFLTYGWNKIINKILYSWLT
jgi:hypothetical protein